MSFARVNRIFVSLALVFALVLSQLSIASAICLCDTPGAMACCATMPVPKPAPAETGCCAGDAADSEKLADRLDPLRPILASASGSCRLGIESTDLAPLTLHQSEHGARSDVAARAAGFDLDPGIHGASFGTAATERGPPGLCTRPIYERISSYLI